MEGFCYLIPEAVTIFSYSLFLDRVLNSLSCKDLQAKTGKKKMLLTEPRKNRYQTSKKKRKLVHKKKLEKKAFYFDYLYIS